MNTVKSQGIAKNSAMEALALSVKKPSTNGNTAMELLALSTKNINQPPRQEKLFDPTIIARELLENDQQKLNKFLDLLGITDYPDIYTCNKWDIVKVPVNQKKPQIILLNCDLKFLDKLPVKPTLVVQYKEKITCFWVLNKPCHKYQYHKLTAILRGLTYGTKKFKNPEIPVYVPGFTRKFKDDNEPIPVTILENSGITYDYEVLLEKIDNKKKKKKKKCKSDGKIQVSIDAEWQGNTFLSLQVNVNDIEEYYFVNKEVIDPIPGLQELVSAICYNRNKDAKLYIIERDDDTNLMDIVCTESNIIEWGYTIELIMYYSPKDLEYAFGWNYIKSKYMSSIIKQRRNITSKGFGFQSANEDIYELDIKDVKGWSNTSLKEFLSGLGIKMENKDKLDKYKKEMITGFYNVTEDSIYYAMDDPSKTLVGYNTYRSTIKDISKNVLGVDIDNEDKIPMTTGSLVNKLFEKALQQDFKNNSKDWGLAFVKHGILNTDESEYKEIRELKEKVDNKQATKEETLRYYNYKDKGFLFLTHQQASVQYLGLLHDSRAYSAIVMGGRCHNAQPWDYRVENGADIDLKSCYGSALSKLTYPVGLPTVLGFTANQKRITLKQFLKRFEAELVDDLYTITVNGTLPKTSQDLIYSKVVGQTEINKAMACPVETTNIEGEVSKIPGNFGIAQKEIKNGIITSDILKIIRQVGNNKEINEYMSLEVESAVFYKASDRIESHQEWVDVINNDNGELIIKDNDVLDSRSRAWYGYSLEKFVGKLVKKRNELKAEGKATGNSSKIAFQNLLKTIQNTLYGDLVSPFFLNSNVVVGNVITAKARVGSWMVEKSLNCRQIITDGGFYTPSKVCWIKPGAKLPSLSTFADMKNWEDKKNYHRKYVPMGGKDWDQVFKNLDQLDNKKLAKEFDELAIAHINQFWEPYNLKLDYEVEHKEDNFFKVAGYWNKGHYCFKQPVKHKKVEDFCNLALLRGTDKLSTSLFWVRSANEWQKWYNVRYKVRGHKQFLDEPELKRNPMYNLLENIVNYVDDFPTDLSYHKKSLLTVTKWLQAQKCDGFEYLDGKRPGDEVIEYRETTRFNDNHIHNQTIKDLERKANRKTRRAGKDIPFFERYAVQGIDKVNQLINKGKLK